MPLFFWAAHFKVVSCLTQGKALIMHREEEVNSDDHCYSDEQGPRC